MVILLSRIQLLIAKFFAIFSIIKFSRLKCFCFFAFIFLKEKKRKKEDFLLKKSLSFLIFLEPLFKLVIC
jgi:hypothetical protein